MTTYIQDSAIRIEDRQRKEITPKELAELKRSILSKGLMHAPVIIPSDEGMKLVAGERRIRAMQELHLEGHVFNYNGVAVPANQIPYITIAEMTLVDLMEAELEENLLRAPLTWLEECEAKAKIHELRTGKNPKQTITQTAKEIAAKQGRDPVATTSTSGDTQALRIALLVDKHKSDPAVAKAKNLRAAQKIVLDKMEAAMRAKIYSATSTFKPKHTLTKGDCRDLLPTFADNSFDLIFSDPPYGINADSAKKGSQHYYDDSPDNALEIYHKIISEGFRIGKPKSSLLLWCDIDFFIQLRTFAAQQGWVCWRTPLVFYKGSAGHAPWGRAGFVRTYEILLYAVKGARELYAPGGPDVFHGPDLGVTSNKGKIHAAEKPVYLLTSLLSKILLEGQSVLDPCCGSGPIFPAADKVKAIATGIELDQHYYNVAASRLSTLDNPAEEEDDGEENKENEEDDDLDDLLNVPSPTNP